MSESYVNPDLPPPIYPTTEFLAAATPDMDPLGRDLVRAVYLAHYFGQGHTELTQGLAGMAGEAEVVCWSEERARYPEIRREVTSFFGRDGSAKVATAALEHYEVADQDGLSHDKAEGMATAWRAFSNALPSYDALLKTPTLTERIRARAKAQEPLSLNPLDAVLDLPKEIRGQVNRVKSCIPDFRLHSLFVEMDAASVRFGRPAGSYEGDDAHISFVRECVMRRPEQVVESTAFNLIFAGFQGDLLKGFYKPSMRELKHAWKEHHDGQFMPQAFDDWRSIGMGVSGFLDRVMLFWSSVLGA